MQLGDMIRVTRIENGYTVEYLAKLMKVTPSSIYNWERRRTVPTLEMLVKLSKILGLSIDELTRVKPSPRMNALEQLNVIRPDGSIDVERIKTIKAILDLVENYRNRS